MKILLIDSLKRQHLNFVNSTQKQYILGCSQKNKVLRCVNNFLILKLYHFPKTKQKTFIFYFLSSSQKVLNSFLAQFSVYILNFLYPYHFYFYYLWK